MTRRITPLAYSIHPEGESPIFGECVTHIRADDEAAGLFFVVSQPGFSGSKHGEIHLDPGELADVLAAAEMLRLAHGGEQ